MTPGLLFGVLAAFFFSSTFILNRVMSLEGGHWVWSAGLRFGYMALILMTYQYARYGRQRLTHILKLLGCNWRFWMLTGSIGFGLFYALICFSAAYAAGWIVATTWQATILASPLVLALFGRNVPRRGLIMALVVFTGILLVAAEHAAATTLRQMLLGAVPVLVAAIAYPLGNQLVWEAHRGTHLRIPAIPDPLLDDSTVRVLLLTLGSVPFWLLLVLTTAPPLPSSGQLMNTALVALFSGVIGTSLFLHARHLCRHPHELAAVDATQSLEVVFSLLGEMLLLQGQPPGMVGILGILLVIIGLTAYSRIKTSAL